MPANEQNGHAKNLNFGAQNNFEVQNLLKDLENGSGEDF